jgi:hypothetical protein
MPNYRIQGLTPPWILEVAKERAWLAKATNAIGQHWKEKNLRKENRGQVMDYRAIGASRDHKAIGANG